MGVTYKQWVNDTRTVLVTQWDNGIMTVAFREETWHTWGPPVTVKLETE